MIFGGVPGKETRMTTTDRLDHVQCQAYRTAFQQEKGRYAEGARRAVRGARCPKHATRISYRGQSGQDKQRLLLCEQHATARNDAIHYAREQIPDERLPDALLAALMQDYATKLARAQDDKRRAQRQVDQADRAIAVAQAEQARVADLLQGLGDGATLRVGVRKESEADRPETVRLYRWLAEHAPGYRWNVEREPSGLFIVRGWFLVPDSESERYQHVITQTTGPDSEALRDWLTRIPTPIPSVTEAS